MAELNSIPSTPDKITGCMSCGTSVTYRTNSLVYCKACRKQKKRESSRQSAEKKRRQNGVLPVKNTTSKCVECQCDFVRMVARQKRCSSCQRKERTMSARRHSSQRSSIPERRIRYNLWYQEKCKTDPKWRLNRRMGSMMSGKLSKRGLAKEGVSWRNLVDYSVADLASHLERQFLPGMSWGNYGKWHIDHIIPCSSFEFESPDDPEFKACWALSNLRPLWANENVRKQAQRIYLI